MVFRVLNFIPCSHTNINVGINYKILYIFNQPGTTGIAYSSTLALVRYAKFQLEATTRMQYPSVV